MVYRLKSTLKRFGVLLLVLLPLPSFAQDTETLLGMSLQELLNIHVESTTKTSIQLREAPGTVYSFSQDDFRKFGIQSIDNLYWFISGVQPYNYKKNNVIAIRGVIERFNSRSQHRVDDVIVENGYYNHEEYDAFYPLDWIESYEMILGPGSALYGANAFSGISAIHLLGFSSRPELKLSADTRLDPTLPQLTGTFRNRNFVVGLTGASGDLPHPSRNIDGTPFNQLTETKWYHGFAKVNVWNHGYAFVRAGMQEKPYMNNKRLVGIILRKAPTIAGVNLNFGDPTEKGKISLNASHSIQNQEEEVKATGKTETQDVSLSDADLIADRKFSAVELLFGLNYRREHADDVKFNDGTQMLYQPNVTLNNYAVYGEAIADLYKHVQLTVGLRYDNFDKFEDKVNWRAALVAKPMQNSVVKVLAGTAIRTPSMREWNKVMEGTSFVQPMVKPEEITTIELAYNQLIFEKVFFDVTLFRNDFKNMLYDISTPPTNDDPEGGADEYFINNTAKVKIQGAEANVKVKIAWILATAGYSYIDPDYGSGAVKETELYIRKHKVFLNAAMNVYKSHSLVLGLTGFSKANDENDKKFTDDEPKGFVYFNAAINGNITSALSYMAGFRNFANTQVFDPYWRSTKYLNIERMDRRIWIGLKYALKW